ncbi:MAG: FAD-dependent oxidoreductase [Clostridia bacterium]|nr:FAD-dependent oxidoreductase [Clostridia bacterium]
MADRLIYTKEIPSLGHYELVVLGGGPAGVCAAIEAARNGAKVLLIEGSGMLGGMATTGLVGPFMTNYDREGERPTVGGLYREIIERLEARSGAILPENTDSPSIHTSFIKRYHRHVTPFDSFMLQIVLDEMVREAGVGVLMYTRFADCVCEGGKIRSVILAALEGLRCVSADLFIDATGNADVAYAAGVPTWKGEEESGVPQPGTLMFEVDGVSDEGYNAHAKRPGGPTGAVKAYRTPTEGIYKINHLRVFNTDATDSASMTRAHVEARRQVLESYRVLQETPGFENARITQVAPVLGVRESRHIEGKYKVTVADVSGGVKFEDCIATYAFGMDVHPRNAEMKGNFKIEIANVYYVPYRAMLPIGCDNLLVAGKTISCESQAAGGIRVMPCAMAIGQAAGAAAAIALRDQLALDAVRTEELQSVLRAHGAILD